MSYEHHGHAGTGRRSKEYQCWLDMKQRCLNEECYAFPYYGARGITVCDRWKESFSAFLVDMGERPVGTTLDRIDNDGHYEPGNCRWATRAEQVANRGISRLVEVNGEMLPLKEACRRLGLNHKTVAGRIDKGWPIDRALTPPLWTRPDKRRAAA